MKLRLVKKIKEANDTLTFVWQPETKVKHLPGQYFYFTLLNTKLEDSRGPTRHFTLSSSPTEGENLMFTTRIRDSSGYKQELKSLKRGVEVEGEGPNGTFILDEYEPGPHVLLAGGIGITPFRSILKNHIDKKLDTNLHLIYSIKVPELITFRKDLESWNKKYENIKVDMTITRPGESKQKWTGLTGRIDGKLISKLTKSYKNPTYWVVGPPPMVDALERSLGRLRIPSGRIRTEKFTGY